MGRLPDCKPRSKGKTTVPKTDKRKALRGQRLRYKRPAAAAAKPSMVQGRRAAKSKAKAGARAQELRAALPLLWARSRKKAACKEKTAETDTARLTIGDFRRLLQGQGGKNEVLSDRLLLRTLRVVERGRSTSRDLGFRFQDPSPKGSWSVSNLMGFTKRPTAWPTTSRSRSQVSWDQYVSVFRLRILENGRRFEVVRSRRRNPVTAVVERRKPGAGSLANVSVWMTCHSRRKQAEDSRKRIKVERRKPGAGSLANVSVWMTCHSRRKQAEDSRKRIKVERCPANLLPAVTLRLQHPPSSDRWTFIYLHGLGSSALGNYVDRPHYFLDGYTSLKVIVPTAPLRELTCFDTWWVTTKCADGSKRKRLNRFNAWYDYLTNRFGRREDKIDEESLRLIREAIHQLVRREIQELGGRADRLILGGKSQGCCTSLDALLTYPERLGGFVGLVGHILSITPVEEGGPQTETPLHFIHEPEDDIMQWSWVQHGISKLKEAGYHVYSQHKKDPEKHGHMIEGIEGRWLRAALRSITTQGS
eukprot:gnl/TRDRNA2_/TRDRNA2_115511_c1_seq1.p1 gnl/TRDRNA2_/TRDRNA2_115511_c1~~gnl/TRDRNA2_/TRDRNA2_115511_c1_seq1.p1  ORF type:complete len:532 (+),score=70.66 gnl/TRDRNA2_/TRDRNA2_115511_c1_seq1:67-1662(+)